MHDDGLFDEQIAATYDDDKGISAPEVIEPAVDLLAELAGGGRALEFAIGTGRIALPLARKGVQVEGIELSRPMVSRLRAKKGGAEISVAIGDMVTTDVREVLTRLSVVSRTNNLTSQDAQLACSRNAAAHLEPGGHFLIEVGVRPLQRLPVGETILVRRRRNALGRRRVRGGEPRFSSITSGSVTEAMSDSQYCFRYAWPAEFDRTARLAV